MTLTKRQYEIIASTGKILTNKGVSGLTVKNLAKEIGFSEAAIYRHFKSKEDILVGMLIYLEENMNKRLNNIDKKQPLLSQFNEIFTSQLLFFKENTQFVVAVFSDGLMEENIRINSHIENIMKLKYRALYPIIEQLQQDKIFTNKVSTNEILNIIMGTFRLMMFKWKNAHFEGDIIKKGHQTINSLLTILKL